MERHMDSGVFLVPSPSINYSGSGSFVAEGIDLKSPEISRVPMSSKVAPLEDEAYKQLDAIEYNEDQLQDHFLMNIVLFTQNLIRTKPIEYYESVLYSTTVNWVNDLSKRTLTLEAVSELHHIEQLRKHEGELAEDEIALMRQVRQKLLGINPALEAEFDVFSSLLDICSGLAIKWGIFSESKYQHRTDVKLLTTSTFDLVELCNNLLNVETYWLIGMLKDEPLASQLSSVTKALAEPLIEQTFAVFAFLLNMNKGNMDKDANIDMYLASKSEEFAQMMNITVSSPVAKPDYQALTLSTGMCACCRRRGDRETLKRLKVMLTEMETAYYTFEEAVFSSFIPKE